jgi:hypothetical protein
MADQASIAQDVPTEKGMGTLDKDALELEHLGVQPSKMKRSFNVWSLLFMSFCTSVTWEAISSTLAQALTSGGSSSLVWGYVAAAVGAMLIVLPMAEYSSMIPTAGGQYHYVAELAPLRFRRVFSWYAGWITMMGWILCATAGIFATAMQIQSWAILFSTDYEYERWHTSLVCRRCPRFTISRVTANERLPSRSSSPSRPTTPCSQFSNSSTCTICCSLLCLRTSLATLPRQSTYSYTSKTRILPHTSLPTLQTSVAGTTRE